MSSESRFTGTKYSGSYEGFLDRKALKIELEKRAGCVSSFMLTSHEIGKLRGKKHTHFAIKFSKKPGRSLKSFDFGDMIAKVKSVRTEKQFEFDVGYASKEGLEVCDYDEDDEEYILECRQTWISTHEHDDRESTIESLVDDPCVFVQLEHIKTDTSFGTAPNGRPFSKKKTMIPISKLNVHVYGPYIWGYDNLDDAKESVRPLLVGEIEHLTKLWYMRPWKPSFNLDTVELRWFQKWLRDLIRGPEKEKAKYRNKLLWITDYIGQNGKSWLWDLLDKEVKDLLIIRPSAYKNIATLIQNHKQSRGVDTIIVDLPRKFKVTDELFELLEELCKGRVSVEKWSSIPFVFADKPPLIIVTWNNHPEDVSAFSPERWFIKVINPKTKEFYKEFDYESISEYLREDSDRNYDKRGMSEFCYKERLEYKKDFNF